MYNIYYIVAGRLFLSRKKNNKVPELVLHKCKAYINNKIKPDDIPTLIPSGALKEIQKNDPDPYYVIETIKDITKPANRVIFTEKFWNGYLKEIEYRPIPGSKYGHEISNYSRAKTDLYCIGGKIDGKKVHLKNYIPPMGDSSDNTRFIQDCRVGIVHFSIVAYTKDEYNEETGEITAVEFSHGARNDAVEYGTGAMRQKVNKNKKQRESDDIKQQNTGGKYIMPENELQEILQNLDNRITNGSISKDDIAKQLKMNMVQSEHAEALKLLKDIKEIVGDDPVKTIKQMKDNADEVLKTAYNNKREKAMSDEFGQEKITRAGKEEENLKRQAAEPHVSRKIISDEELKQQIEKAKENSVVKKLSFDIADYTSEENDLTGIVSQQKKNTDDKYSSEIIEL